MPRGYRSAFVAVGLTLASFAYAQPVSDDSRPPERIEQGQTEPGHDAKPRAPVSIQDVIERIARALEAENAQEEPAYQREYAQRDLSAQERMAKWTFWMFFAALASVLLTGVGVWLIWRTLEATKLAAIHAGRAVDQATAGTEAALLAAKEAEHSNTILRVEQRPWLTLQREVECTFVVRQLHKADLEWSYTLHNHGKTPALDVKVYQKIIRSTTMVGDKLWTREAIETAKNRAKSSITKLIIFPSETTAPYRSIIGQKLDTPGENYFLIFCIVYRGVGVEGFGTEARVFSISEETDESDGRKIWKLLEHQRLGIIE